MKSLTLLICGTFILSGCSLIEKKDSRLSGEGVTTHSLADGQIELKMKISALTSNLWITTELFNNSGQELHLQTADLIEFENPECFEVRDQIENTAAPIRTQEFSRFRYSYFWKGRRKSDPLYETCLVKPMRFTLRGIEHNRQALVTPKWTIQP
jgi:hypothetical protein